MKNIYNYGNFIVIMYVYYILTKYIEDSRYVLYYYCSEIITTLFNPKCVQ